MVTTKLKRIDCRGLDQSQIGRNGKARKVSEMNIRHQMLQSRFKKVNATESHPRGEGQE